MLLNKHIGGTQLAGENLFATAQPIAEGNHNAVPSRGQRKTPVFGENLFATAQPIAEGNHNAVPSRGA